MNVLFITADQWRGDCLSLLDHACLRTPHLDALAAAGVVFTRHYCQATPCGPSRASLHTGLYLMNHRSVTNGTPLDRRHRNWAQILRESGWNPVLFGYTDTSVDPRDYPPRHPVLNTYEGILPGLDCRLHVNLGDTTAWARWLAEQGHALPSPTERLYRVKAPGVEWENGGAEPLPLAIAAHHHDTRFVTERAIEYIQAAPRDAPWCVHLSLLRPHPPWIAPRPYNAMYPPDALPGYIRAPSRAGEAQHPWLAHAMHAQESRLPHDERKLQRLKASYYGLISEVDDNLGRLFAALRTQGLWQDTLIIFTADHGEQLGDHWLLGKGGYFDQSYHVPLIIRDPASARRGTRVDAFTEHVDLMPTLLDRLALDIPPQCDGRSLRPFLESSPMPADWRREVHWEYDFRDLPGIDALLGLPSNACNLCVIRDARFKYVHFAGLAPLLFDLESDPSELVDCSTDPAHASVMIEYTQRMLSWRLRHTDQSLTHLRLGPSDVRQ